MRVSRLPAPVHEVERWCNAVATVQRVWGHGRGHRPDWAIDRYGAGDPERNRAYVAEILSAKSSVGRAGGDADFFEPRDRQFSAVLSTTTLPAFITQRTLLMVTSMSARGSPSTATISAT